MMKDMKIKILPVTPPITTYIPRDNFIFTILNNNKKILNLFILHNYIDAVIVYNTNFNDYYYRFADSENCFAPNKYLTFSIIHRDVINYVNLDIVKMIKDFIDTNFYVLLNIDCFYVEAYNIKTHYSHEIMIYGYDDEHEQFFTKDFFNGYSYDENMCSYHEISLAFYSYPEHDLKANYDGIVIAKINDLADYSMDYVDIKNKLYNFINDFPVARNSRNYGISIFDIITLQLKDEIYNGVPFHFLRNKIGFLREHVFLMKLRVDYFVQQGHFQFNYILLILDQLLKQSENLKNKCIKMLIKKIKFDVHLHSPLIQEIEKFKCNYVETIRYFITELEKID